MSRKSTIEWTGATWNAVRGCTLLSPGCLNCYAKVFAERFRGVEDHPYQQGFDLRLVPEKLAEPLRWAVSKVIFVNSMSDLFHADVPTEFIAQCGRVMQRANWHTFQVLTKRSGRLNELLNTSLTEFATCDNIWWGVSVENKKHGLPRVEHLRGTPAAVRFLSIEPLLEDLGQINLEGIHWVIVGGESGAGCRKMEPAWVLNILEQCRKAQVPFFFKQWGGFRKAKKGRLLEGRLYDEMPSRGQHPVPDKVERMRLIEEAETWAKKWAEPLVACTVGATKSPQASVADAARGGSQKCVTEMDLINGFVGCTT